MDNKTQSPIPNAATLEAMRQVRDRDGLTGYASLEELMAGLSEYDLDKFLPG